MKIEYKTNVPLNVHDIIHLYRDSGLNRPIDDVERITKMFAHSNLVISAWEQDTLIGVARSVTDFSFCCYLSDLAVSKAHQHKGIGKTLVKLTKEAAGDQSMLLLLSVSSAMDYYPKIGMEHINNAFLIKRK